MEQVNQGRFLEDGSRKVLPSSLEAERSLIGGVILQGKAFVIVAPLVAADDFFHPAHRAIFESFIELDRAGQPLDSITVAEHMRSAGTFDKLRAVNGEAYFAELTSAVVTIENIAFHARIVRGKATIRRLIEKSTEIATQAYGDYGDPDEFIAGAERGICDITQGAQTGVAVGSLKPAVREAIKRLEYRADHKNEVLGVPSGFLKIDGYTQGFQAAELVIIAARPSMGKTSLVMNAACNAAREHNIPSLVFSAEMSRESLTDRLLAGEARVDAQRLRSGHLDLRDWTNLTAAASHLSEYPIWIDDTSAPSMLDIRAKARQWRNDQSRGGQQQKAMIIIDYLQLVRWQSGGKDTNREREIAEIARGLKALAKDLRCPVLALSQLNRRCEERADKRPMLSDLRESGEIEQAADVILFIYRDEHYNKDSPDKGVAEVNVGKQRSGPLGTVRLAFLNQYTRFENLAERDEH